VLLRKLPATIRDATTATTELARRYLWADRLCLVRNDFIELQEYVELMGRIYCEAAIINVAANGKDAHVGLPGVKPSPRNPLRLVGEVVLGVAYDDDS
jgi:Heterokaryon incompatibility protein (HET)